MLPLEAAVPKWLADYRRILQTLWGVPIGPEQVHVSLNLIELAWDALTPDTASLGARLFLHEWNTSIARAKHAFIVDRLEHDADGALRGIGASGEQLKLYRKTQDFLRFEAQITHKSGLKILKGACEKSESHTKLDLDDLPGFIRDLTTIAARVYPTILGVQQSVMLPPPVGLPLLLAKMARKPFERDVVDGLLNNGAVKCGNQNMYRFLRDLQRDGLVQIGPGKGVWSATRTFAQELRLPVARAKTNRNGSYHDEPTNRTWRYPPHWHPFRAICRRRIYATRVRGARWFTPPQCPPLEWGLMPNARMDSRSQRRAVTRARSIRNRKARERRR